MSEVVRSSGGPSLVNKYTSKQRFQVPLHAHSHVLAIRFSIAIEPPRRILQRTEVQISACLFHNFQRGGGINLQESCTLHDVLICHA
eukprot:SAG31_NODE_322_length_17726_cov_18.070006_8_plen_87_part_00